MRIIAGTAKGVRLAPVPRGVRPVSDMAREGLFSSIASDVPGAAVLDLYAGTGALGIEALSRGAERAAFVDRSRPALATIRRNLDRTALAERGAVIASAVTAFVTGMTDRQDRSTWWWPIPPTRRPRRRWTPCSPSSDRDGSPCTDGRSS